MLTNHLKWLNLVQSTILITNCLIWGFVNQKTSLDLSAILHNNKSFEFRFYYQIFYQPKVWFGIINHFIYQKFGLVISTRSLFWYHQQFYLKEVWFGSINHFITEVWFGMDNKKFSLKLSSMYLSTRLQSCFLYYQPFYLSEVWFGIINHFITQKFGLVLSSIYPPNFWLGIIDHFINQKFGFVLSIFSQPKVCFGIINHSINLKFGLALPLFISTFFLSFL